MAAAAAYLPACQGRRPAARPRPRQWQQPACLPARGGGGPTSQGRAVVVLVRGGSACPAMAVAVDCP